MKILDLFFRVVSFLKNKTTIDDKKIPALIKKSVAMKFSIKPSGVGASKTKKYKASYRESIELKVNEKNEWGLIV